MLTKVDPCAELILEFENHLKDYLSEAKFVALLSPEPTAPTAFFPASKALSAIVESSSWEFIFYLSVLWDCIMMFNGANKIIHAIEQFYQNLYL